MGLQAVNNVRVVDGTAIPAGCARALGVRPRWYRLDLRAAGRDDVTSRIAKLDAAVGHAMNREYVVVGHLVMVRAQLKRVVDGGFAARAPRLDVVHIHETPVVATGEAAPVVAKRQCAAQRRRHRARLASDIEGVSAFVLENGYDAGVAQEAVARSGRNPGTVLELACEVVGIDVYDHFRGWPVGFVAARRVFGDGHEPVGVLAGVRSRFGCGVDGSYYQRGFVGCELRCDSHHAIVGIPRVKPALRCAFRRSVGPLYLSIHPADLLQLLPRCVPGDIEEFFLVFRRCNTTELSRHKVADLSAAQRLINAWQRTQLARRRELFPSRRPWSAQRAKSTKRHSW